MDDQISMKKQPKRTLKNSYKTLRKTSQSETTRSRMIKSRKFLSKGGNLAKMYHSFDLFYNFICNTHTVLTANKDKSCALSENMHQNSTHQSALSEIRILKMSWFKYIISTSVLTCDLSLSGIIDPDLKK